MEITNKYNYCINKGKRLIETIKEILKNLVDLFILNLTNEFEVNSKYANNKLLLYNSKILI